MNTCTPTCTSEFIVADCKSVSEIRGTLVTGRVVLDAAMMTLFGDGVATGTDNEFWRNVDDVGIVDWVGIKRSPSDETVTGLLGVIMESSGISKVEIKPAEAGSWEAVESNNKQIMVATSLMLVLCNGKLKTSMCVPVCVL